MGYEGIQFNIAKRSTTMQLLFDINRSLKVNPILDRVGIVDPERIVFDLSELVVVDEKGVSLQPREKELEDNRAEGEGITFKQDGVLYDKEVMVTERRKDGKLELVSGFNRRDNLIEMGITKYFGDAIKFESPFYKTLWKRAFNSGKDHRAMGVPNTEGSYIKGLLEAKRLDQFDSTDDDAVRNAIDFMAQGKKNPEQIEKILGKFRETNSKELYIRALNIHRANEYAQALGLPTGGYVKNTSKKDGTPLPQGEVGYVRHSGDFLGNLAEWVNLHDWYKEKIKITFYVRHAGHADIQTKRQVIMDAFDKAVDWVKNHLDKKYWDIFEVQGFIAQIRDPDPDQGGHPKERGLVDVKGKIIRE